MKRCLAHLSDLHFGREDPMVVQRLTEDLIEQNPSVIAVSGDLTQRAKTNEFRAAKAFLDELPFSKLIVPGNHDIPLYNLHSRFLHPFSRFQKLIQSELSPIWMDSEIAILGLNSVQPFLWKEGSLADSDLSEVEKNLEKTRADHFKILVMHHSPFKPSDSNTKPALKWLEKNDIRIVLTGHLHLGNSQDLPYESCKLGRSLLWVQAGTAVSMRTRDEANSYNVLNFEEDSLKVSVRMLTQGKFKEQSAQVFRLRKN